MLSSLTGKLLKETPPMFSPTTAVTTAGSLATVITTSPNVSDVQARKVRQNYLEGLVSFCGIVFDLNGV